MNKLQYAGTAILSVYIPDEPFNAWSFSPPSITILKAGGTARNGDGIATAFIPTQSVEIEFYGDNAAEIDALIETLQAIKRCITPPQLVNDNPLEF